MEAFEALRAPVRMLGVRKGGLGVKVSLFGMELMLPVDRLVAQVARGSPLAELPCTSACHASCAGVGKKTAWWERGRRGYDEMDQGSSGRACLARELKILRPRCP